VIALQRPRSRSAPTWLGTLRGYALFVGAANLLWEILQVPLYTIWNEGTFGEIAFSVVHCTGGDVLIALACLVAALILFGGAAWPTERSGTVAAVAVTLGLAYTVYSEWRNVVVRESWAYSNLMPVVPPLDTGLSPLLQWLIVPIVGLAWARRTAVRTTATSPRPAA